MRVLRYVRLGVGAALALSVCATAAVGQQPPSPYPECNNKKPSAEDVEAAKGAHTTAGQFYDRGDYDSAIAQWLIAYNKFDCTAHGLLLNIANAQEKKGDKAAAIISLQTYLDRMKQNAAPNVAQRLANLRAAVAPVPTAQPSAVPSAPPTAPTSPSTAPTVVPTAPTAVPTAPPPDGQRPYGVVPWVPVIGGSALALVGLILLPVGQSAISDANAKCPNRTCPPNTPGGQQAAIDEGNKGRTETTAGWATLTIGVAAAAGGLVWQLLYNKPAKAPPSAPADKAALHVVPLLGPGQGGVGVAGSF
jgi:hypothetical protein